MTFRTRFAPSPTGPLHLGHAYSALCAYDMAQAEGGEFLLRIEDIDQTRARPHWETQIYDDLTWLGLNWPQPVMRQSERQPRYTAALNDLWARDLIYPCSCSRRDIQLAASAPQEGVAPTFGPDGLIYPGTCRISQTCFAPSPLPRDAALRLNVRAALEAIKTPLRYTDTEENITIDCKKTLTDIGDVVLARRDMATSYHLSVALDDADQQITHVIRGADLAEASRIHVILQALLNLPTPVYHHHRLIRDNQGKRLAKRDDARAIARYRADGLTPQDIRAMVGL